MKKSFRSRFSSRYVALLIPCVLIAVAVTWRVYTSEANVTGQVVLSSAAQRHVENVQCTGACENILLVSNQEPGVRYYAGGDCPTCIEANIWAGQTREGEITINGYAFYDGVQVNLAPQIFDAEVLDGRPLGWVLPLYPPGTVFPSDGPDPFMDPSFNIRLKDTGDENVIDTFEFIPTPDSSAENITIVTDHASGRVTAFDTCTQTNKDTDIYALYQAPNLHGPQNSDSYAVTIEHRESLAAGTITGGTSVFQKEFIFEELSEQKLHVTATIGDATFTFDLVKD